ncbi:hypothetical protein FRC00_011482 [Tulasnella sp. 408]|nr:hypothetical protein FRC00_011482 [Tulasnella sp. 408]
MEILPAVLLDFNYNDEKTKIEHFLRNFVSLDLARVFGEMDLEDHEDEGMGGEDWGTDMKQLVGVVYMHAGWSPNPDCRRPRAAATNSKQTTASSRNRLGRRFKEGPSDAVLHQRREQQAQSQAENPSTPLPPPPPELMRQLREAEVLQATPDPHTA